MTEPRDVPQPGRILADRYQLQKVLGQGGMGTVWEAQHLVLDSAVAVKVLSSPDLGEEAERRFLKEARAAAQLSTPHVVRLFDYGVEDGIAFLVMELLQGETLATRLQRQGRLPPAQTADVLRQLCRGVGNAHQAQLVHRDLKPDNVFLVDNDSEVLVKVLDFGIAKSLRPDETARHATRTGAMMGTLPYMSPEQIDDPKRVGPTSDVWSLGVIAYECVVGEHPFPATTFGRLVGAITRDPLPVPSQRGVVPDGFDEWFAIALSRRPEQRFTSMRDASHALDRCFLVPAVQPWSAASGLRGDTEATAMVSSATADSTASGGPDSTASGVPDTAASGGAATNAPVSGAAEGPRLGATFPTNARALALGAPLAVGVFGAIGWVMLPSADNSSLTQSVESQAVSTAPPDAGSMGRPPDSDVRNEVGASWLDPSPEATAVTEPTQGAQGARLSGWELTGEGRPVATSAVQVFPVMPKVTSSVTPAAPGHRPAAQRGPMKTQTRLGVAEPRPASSSRRAPPVNRSAPKGDHNSGDSPPLFL